MELIEEAGDSGIINAQDFSSEEMKALNNFFDTKIANKTDLVLATKEFSNLFNDRTINQKLRNRIIESFLYASDSVSFNS